MQQKEKNKKKVWAFAIIGVVVLAVAGITIFSMIPKADKRIKVGSKNFTEQLILGNLYADLIESNTDITVERMFSLGGTQPCMEAMKAGSIDMYLEYTGTTYLTILKNDFEVLPNDVVFERIRQQMHEQYGIQVFDEIGFNNAYCLAVTRQLSEEKGITKISDLEKISGELRLIPSFEFVNREDGMLALEDKYTIDFKEIIPMEGGLKYTAIESGQGDVVIAFGTDGMLKKLDLIVLEDDRSALVNHRALPLVLESTLEKYPELSEAVNLLAGRIDDKVMQELNYKVDEQKMLPEDVAREYLVSQGLYKAK